MNLIDLGQSPDGDQGFVMYLKSVCQNLDLAFASYAAASPVTGSMHAFTTYPAAWKRHYMERGLHRVDPTLTRASRSIAPVDWRRLKRDRGFSQVFRPAREFGLPSQGLTIPVRGPYGETGLFSVTSDSGDRVWDRQVPGIIGTLQATAVQLHDRVMNSEDIMSMLRRPVLSRREKEILQWVAAGKSQQDIGDILSISHRTVEVHLRSAREKLSALTTAQAIGRAISLGIILPA